MSKAPIWEMYPDLEDLARRTGYKTSYLEFWRKHSTEPSDGFKRRVAAALGKPESELFGEPVHAD